MSKSKSFSRKIVNALIERDGQFCHYCGKEVLWWSEFIPTRLGDGTSVQYGKLIQFSPYVIVVGYTGHNNVTGEPSYEFQMEFDESIGLATIDHKLPRTKGGTHEIDNLVLCCSTCNTTKSNRYTYEEFKALKQGGAT